MNTGDYRILLVDDEHDILEFLGYNLRREGYEVFTANNGREAILAALQHKPHLILLDIMMPEMDGIETCIEMRSHPELGETVIAFLTARGEDYSQIAGFEAGGDDYITKPVKPRVLLTRIWALLKRAGKPSRADAMKKEELTIDRERYLVILRGKEITVPRKEFELLTLLMEKPGKVFTREEIFHKVWGDNIIVGDRTIDVHIRKLREKIGDKFISTVKGVGYKFRE